MFYRCQVGIFLNVASVIKWDKNSTGLMVVLWRSGVIIQVEYYLACSENSVMWLPVKINNTRCFPV